ncbi:hypothetical protein [Azomonas macrocytogenes]|uniref:Uncharacterized protein n=1 Tax=Azomonas macrocytogenes TaxID=69962 RepID=A0A839T882_AZOMA|nr:hypothetical protein [Azomonas macrocytogenes]MBB3105070.1 hypothetical protein [Azomonas macrocytogenes]
MRFVGEHLVRHAKARRENFPVEPSLLPQTPARRLRRTAGAAAWGQCLGGDQRAALHQGRGLAVEKIASPLGSAAKLITFTC